MNDLRGNASLASTQTRAFPSILSRFETKRTAVSHRIASRRPCQSLGFRGGNSPRVWVTIQQRHALGRSCVPEMTEERHPRHGTDTDNGTAVASSRPMRRDGQRVPFFLSVSGRCKVTASFVIQPCQVTENLSELHRSVRSGMCKLPENYAPNLIPSVSKSERAVDARPPGSLK